MYGEGVKAAERAVELSGPDDARRLGFLGHTYGLVGRVAESPAILDELLTLEMSSYVPASAIAAVYLGLGELERALDWIERGFEGHDSDLVLLRTVTLWDPLRGNSRFERIVRQMGFPR